VQHQIERNDVGMAHRVFTAVAEVLPCDGFDHLTGIAIQRGWGDILNVRLSITSPESNARRELGAKLRGAIEVVLGSERHFVQIVWR
jgi:hypothetical protein